MTTYEIYKGTTYEDVVNLTNFCNEIRGEKRKLIEAVAIHPNNRMYIIPYTFYINMIATKEYDVVEITTSEFKAMMINHAMGLITLR